MKNGFPAPNKELAKTKNNHLTGKAPYKFESVSLQRGVSANLIADDLRMALIDLRPYSCASQRHRRKWDREFESGLLQGRVHCEIRSRSRGSSYRVGPT
jgi:hypothetical protein